jgi:hypothetical protein
MFVLLSSLHDFIAAARDAGRPLFSQDDLKVEYLTEPIRDIWMQDDLTVRQLPLGVVTSALTCSAQSGALILIWRSEVETAGLRVPDKSAEIIDAVRARLDTARAILAGALNTALPHTALRPGLLLEPGLLAELPSFKCEQHIWVCSQENGLSTRKVLRRGDLAHAPERID